MDKGYPAERAVARRLAELYDENFGGKERGRFRISLKLLKRMAGRRRLAPQHIAQVAAELYELGYVLIDMESFFVVLSQKTFNGYRRVNEDCLPD